MNLLFEVLGRCLGSRKYFIPCKSVVNDCRAACGSILTFISWPITCPAKHHLAWHCCLCKPSPQACVCSAQAKPWNKAFTRIIIFAGLPWRFILLSSESWWSLSNTHLKSINSVTNLSAAWWLLWWLVLGSKPGQHMVFQVKIKRELIKKRESDFLRGQIGIGQGRTVLSWKRRELD